MDGVTVAADALRIRELIVRMATAAGTAHVASALSIADILAVVYRGGVVDPLGGDRFLLSKGHAASALYAALAVAGAIDPEEAVDGYCRDGGALAGHPERGTPGVEMTGGSLGHGPAIAVGAALADRLDDIPRRTLCLIGDGELDEGAVWEAVMLAGRLCLGSLTLMVDANGLQGLGRTAESEDPAPLAARMGAFGWDAEVVDGHDHDALAAALARRGGRPRCLVCRTVKGRGVAEIEDTVRGHYRSFRPGDLDRLLAGLREAA